MRQSFKLPLFSLLILAAISLSNTSGAHAQAAKEAKPDKEYKDKEAGGPTQGIRRQLEEGVKNYDDRKWRSKEQEMQQREREIERRDAGRKD